MAEKPPFLMFLIHFWILVRQTKIAIFRPICKNLQKKKFCMGPHYVDFTLASDTTLIRIEMAEIWSKYVAQAFLPPPLNPQLRSPPWIGLKHFYGYLFNCPIKFSRVTLMILSIKLFFWGLFVSKKTNTDISVTYQCSKAHRIRGQPRWGLRNRNRIPWAKFRF